MWRRHKCIERRRGFERRVKVYERNIIIKKNVRLASVWKVF